MPKASHHPFSVFVVQHVTEGPGIFRHSVQHFEDGLGLYYVVVSHVAKAKVDVVLGKSEIDEMQRALQHAKITNVNVVAVDLLFSKHCRCPAIAAASWAERCRVKVSPQ